MRNLAAPALLLALTLFAAGCGGDQPGGETAGEDTHEGQAGEAGEGMLAVATVFPLAWLAEEVAPGAEVEFLGARGQDPHDLELSPANREAFETADVLLYMGDIDFQPQVEAATADATGEVVDVAAVAGQERLLPLEEDAHDDDRGAIDPHVWFDPAVMADVARQVGEAFAAADPDHAEEYAANAAAVAEELEGLQAEIDEQLADCRLDTVIVSHEAYAYLLEPRGLEQEGISGAGGHSEASPQRLAELTEFIRERDIPAIAAEPVEGRADAEALAREADAELVEIDPLAVAEEEQRSAGFPQALRGQAAAFATALDCA